MMDTPMIMESPSRFPFTRVERTMVKMMGGMAMKASVIRMTAVLTQPPM